jgi:sugar-phosphatase
VRALLVAGAAGAGKSTLGEALARLTGAALVDLDAVTNSLLDRLFPATGLVGHWYDDLHRPLVRPARYAALLAVAADQVRMGHDVVLTAPFTAELQGGRAWKAVTESLSPADTFVVWLDAAEDLRAGRLRDRAEPRDAAQRSERPLHPPAVPHLALPAGLATQKQLDAVLTALDDPFVQTGPMGTSDNRLEELIIDMLDRRADGATICPSDVARAADAEGWRDLMERVRRAARRRVAEDRVVITQAGEVVDPETATGPIRIRMAQAAAGANVGER